MARKSRENNSPDMVLMRLRGRIAEELKRDGLVVKEVSQLELAIGTFVPSEVVEGFVVSDYPFIESRYISLRDGHVYFVAGTVEGGGEILAYRLGFWHSIFTTKGGIAVSISEDGWMDSLMILFSLQHAHFDMQGGVIDSVDDSKVTRRAYPGKKFKVYRQFAMRPWRTLWQKIKAAAGS